MRCVVRCALCVVRCHCEFVEPLGAIRRSRDRCQSISLWGGRFKMAPSRAQSSAIEPEEGSLCRVIGCTRARDSRHFRSLTLQIAAEQNLWRSSALGALVRPIDWRLRAPIVCLRSSSRLGADPKRRLMMMMMRRATRAIAREGARFMRSRGESPKRGINCVTLRVRHGRFDGVPARLEPKSGQSANLTLSVALI